MTKPTKNFADLVALMQFLRQNCAWDSAQSSQSLAPFMIEEAYELVHAIFMPTPKHKNAHIKDELADVLLQVVFHAQLYQEQGDFDVYDVIFALQDKLIRRLKPLFDAHAQNHPMPSMQQLNEHWQKVKAQNSAFGTQNNAPSHKGSALMRAKNFKSCSASDFLQYMDVLQQALYAKTGHKIADVKNKACVSSSQNDTEDINHNDLAKAVGECVIALANLADQLGIDAETAALQAMAQK